MPIDRVVVEADVALARLAPCPNCGTVLTSTGPAASACFNRAGRAPAGGTYIDRIVLGDRDDRRTGIQEGSRADSNITKASVEGRTDIGMLEHDLIGSERRLVGFNRGRRRCRALPLPDHRLCCVPAFELSEVVGTCQRRFGFCQGGLCRGRPWRCPCRPLLAPCGRQAWRSGRPALRWRRPTRGFW